MELILMLKGLKSQNTSHEKRLPSPFASIFHSQPQVPYMIVILFRNVQNFVKGYVEIDILMQGS